MEAEQRDQSIRQLQAMRDGLRHAAACGAPCRMECPTFRRLPRASSARVFGRSEPMPAPAPRRSKAKRRVKPV